MLWIARLPNGQPEIFKSIQGEGPSIGISAVFLRLGLCNLRCKWCDTKYAWDWSNYDKTKELVAMSLEDAEERILNQNCKRLIITGGEPLIQQDVLKELLTRPRLSSLYVELETNGTIMPDTKLVNLVDQWNVSPKLKNSGESDSSREVPSCYKFFVGLSSAFFKFVIMIKDDLDEVQYLINKYTIPKDRVILMPEARNRKILLSRSRWLTSFCRDTDYRFSTRLHILLWGDVRGT